MFKITKRFFKFSLYISHVPKIRFRIIVKRIYIWVFNIFKKLMGKNGVGWVLASAKEFIG